MDCLKPKYQHERWHKLCRFHRRAGGTSLNCGIRDGSLRGSRRRPCRRRLWAVPVGPCCRARSASRSSTTRRSPAPRERAVIGAGSWQFEDEPLAKLRDKIAKGRKTLGEVYGAPLYGIKTGLNDAFVIDRETRERLVTKDPRSAELLKPFVRGENIQRWRMEPEGLFLINTPKANVDIDAFPAIRDWLLRFKPELERRATKQEWFELQQAQLAYQPKLAATKIVFPDMSQGPKFCRDASGSYCGNTVYFVPSDQLELVALLNSRLTWVHLFGEAEALRGGKWRLRMFSDDVATVPIPELRRRDRAS